MEGLKKNLLVLALLLPLAGCSGGSDFVDIDQFMDEVNSRPKQRIEPLPPFKQVQPFAYQASNMRSPFEPPVVVKTVKAREGVQVKPNFDRIKQYLEQFPVSQLTMVGTLAQGESLFALIRDDEGGVHRVQVGDYIGTDHGKIRSIDDGGVELIEIVADGVGGWVQRARTVALTVGEAA